MDPLWPHRLLDVSALRRDGWHPTPLREFALKIYQRCNLACDYCYVYTKADQSWRRRPIIMPERVWRSAVDRIAEHAEQHALTEVSVILHGGEPLLAGTDRIAAIATAVRNRLPVGTVVRLALQTNGTLLTEPAIRVLSDCDVRVGVSLDGDPANHDRHRPFRDGRRSFLAVDQALRLLATGYPSIFLGILATVDPGADPLACYQTLLDYQPPSMDFLLPHAHWSARHPASNTGRHPFGDWLVRVFDRRYDAPRKETRIRFFEEIINVVLGGRSHTESIRAAVVDTTPVTAPGAGVRNRSVYCAELARLITHVTNRANADLQGRRQPPPG